VLGAAIGERAAAVGGELGGLDEQEVHAATLPR
jgi:hypothetical protein